MPHTVVHLGKREREREEKKNTVNAVSVILAENELQTELPTQMRQTGEDKEKILHGQRCNKEKREPGSH